MNSTEQLVLDIVVKISTGKLGKKEGQKILNVSERTLRRYLAEHGRRGVLFVQHGNTKNVPTNRTDLKLKKQVIKLVRENYYDFNLTHCLEKLKSDHGIVVGRERFRLWCHEIQMVKKAKRRAAKVRRRRDRMAQTGLMLQMDGSPHHWFGGKPSCLIGAIDDADSNVPFAEFFPAEDTLSCMRVLHKIIEKMGIFQILYTDRAGIFGGPKRAQFSQVKRACEELGIHIIFADSPEAKGRIERLWGTLQDRLIPEMRIRNIKSYDGANHFLQGQFLPNEYATRFMVQPENLQTAYKPLPAGINLNEIFCLKEYRSCKRDHTFSWNNEIYRIDSELKHSIYKQQIEIRTYQNLTWKVFFANREIAASLVKEPIKQGIIDQVKEICPLKVRLDGHVTYLHRHYSVAEKYVGEKVSVTESNGNIIIYHRGHIIETHSKITEPGQLCATREEHLLPWKKALEINSSYRTAARRYGQDVEKFVVAVIEGGYGFIDNATIWGVLGMDKTYSAATINDACKTALELGLPKYKTVRILLKLQASRWEPKQLASCSQKIKT